MWCADHCAFKNAVERINRGFDLLWVDVEAACDDQILAASDDLDIAVVVDAPQIAGDEKPVLAQFLAGLFGHLPIAVEQVGAAHFQNAYLALGQGGPSLRVTDFQFDAGQRKADGTSAPVAVVGVGGVHIGFSHAVALEDGMAGCLLPLDMGFGQQRGGAGDEESHGFGRSAKFGHGEEAGVEGRHAHKRGCLRHGADDGAGVEAAHENRAAACHQGDVGGNEQPVGVENRQGVDQDIFAGKTPGVAQHLRV